MLESQQMFLFLFKSKYRRKCLSPSMFNWLNCLILCFIFVEFSDAGGHSLINNFHNHIGNSLKCYDSKDCNGNGVCKNDTCVCNDGWQGLHCQYCAGKVRLAELSGSIHDGIGNYSIGVKCSWLIDAPPNTSTITLYIEEFATECGWDHLYIFDGDSVESPLLAVFSGLMYKDKYSIRRIPVVTAHSGSALVHFFSDDAYNMSGFNITYRINGCPSNQSDLICSGHGVCISGICTCDAKWLGNACHIPICPNDCFSHMGHGLCSYENHGCECFPPWAGSDCNQEQFKGYWTAVEPRGQFQPFGLASAGAIVWRDTMYIVAGQSYINKLPTIYTYDFNGNVWETPKIDGVEPGERYAHSSVLYGDKVYVYGGVVQQNGNGPEAVVTNELWTFDINAKVWEMITVRTEPCNLTFYPYCGPLKSAGHTATLVTSSNKKSDRLVIIFGHSPELGYLNTVQEFYFGTREWFIVREVKGFPVKGGYGHSSAYDQFTGLIYVYGGLISESVSTQTISSKIFSYDPHQHLWKLLSQAPSVRFLHSANFIYPGLMIVFGGNTHNDTSHSFGAKCYSDELLAYDVICDTWHNLGFTNSELQDADLARYGHSTAIFERELYIFGGFNGQMLSDILRYTPGNCTWLRTQQDCLTMRNGVKCVWDRKASKCKYLQEVRRAQILRSDETISENDDRSTMDFLLCPEESRSHKAHLSLLHAERCATLTDCRSCVQTSWGCKWCGNYCSSDNCRRKPTTGAITDLEWCPIDPEPICRVLHSCVSCYSVAINQTCHWDYEMHCTPTFRNINQTSQSQIQQFEQQLLAAARNNKHAMGSNDLPHLNGESSNAQSAIAAHYHHHHHHFSSSQSQAQISSTGQSTQPQSYCPVICADLTSCSNCTQEECIWCQNEARCVDKNAYTISFPYGQCREWTTMSAKCRGSGQKPSSNQSSGDNSRAQSQCAYYKTCSQCRDDPACGWCDDGSRTGLGTCMLGGYQGARQHDACGLESWHFTTCPKCQCNGHSTCYNDNDIISGQRGPMPQQVSCIQPCHNDTVGLHCERCRDGFWGNAINGGKCQKCECNGQATKCNHDTGKCYCQTKGLTGDHCEKCDATNHYVGDPLTAKGSCFYELTIDYQFTFNLSKKEDRHYTQINFRNSPIKPDIDADFTITCSVPAKMNVTVKTAGSNIERPILQALNCTTFRSRFTKAEHQFGVGEDNVTQTTFFVYVYDFQPPLWIQISFSQYPKLNLQQFFITFSFCFLALLLVAAVMWKVKQKYDMYRRRQRLFVEMEQMASRPFSQVFVEIERPVRLRNGSVEIKTNLKKPSPLDLENLLKQKSYPPIVTVRTKKQRKEDPTVEITIEDIANDSKRTNLNLASAPSPIALEPLADNRAAVLSLLVRLPTGGELYTPHGQSAGLAVASALVTLGNPTNRRGSLNELKQTIATDQKKGRAKVQTIHPNDANCL